MEAICSSETSVLFQRTTRRYIPEARTLHNHRCETLKSYNIGFNFEKRGRGEIFCLVLEAVCHIWGSMWDEEIMVPRIRGNKNAYKVLVWKPEGERALERPKRGWEDNVKMHPKQIGFIWLGIVTSGVLLWTRWWTFGFRTMLDISWVAEQVSASQEAFNSVDWVAYV
jgi:hypothetical protein